MDSFLTFILADLFEGDLKLSKEEINYLKEQTMSKKDSVAEVARMWPDARVPYSVHRRFGILLFALAYIL